MRKSEMTRQENGKKAQEVLRQFKTSDSGRFGKAFEIRVKQYLNGSKGNSSKVSLRGKHDVQYKGKIYEIKSNCGEINDDIMKNDYIIYSINNSFDYITPELAKVMTPKEFINALNRCGLIREKKTTNGYKVKAIQSYSNSRKKFSSWFNELEQFETLEEHITNK